MSGLPRAIKPTAANVAARQSADTTERGAGQQAGAASCVVNGPNETRYISLLRPGGLACFIQHKGRVGVAHRPHTGGVFRLRARCDDVIHDIPLLNKERLIGNSMGVYRVFWMMRPLFLEPRRLRDVEELGFPTGG